MLSLNRDMNGNGEGKMYDMGQLPTGQLPPTRVTPRHDNSPPGLYTHTRTILN